MELEVFTKPEVVKALSRFVSVQLYTDTVPIASLNRKERNDLAASNLDRQLTLTNEVTCPLFVILNPDGKRLDKIYGSVGPDALVKFLEKN